VITSEGVIIGIVEICNIISHLRIVGDLYLNSENLYTTLRHELLPRINWAYLSD
jgi:hypothetical protein